MRMARRGRAGTCLAAVWWEGTCLQAVYGAVSVSVSVLAQLELERT